MARGRIGTPTPGARWSVKHVVFSKAVAVEAITVLKVGHRGVGVARGWVIGWRHGQVAGVGIESVLEMVGKASSLVGGQIMPLSLLVQWGLSKVDCYFT